MFQRNVGGLDRGVRSILGGVLLVTGLYQMAGGQGNGLALTILGSFVVITATVGFCPPYALFGFSTARSKGSRSLGSGSDESRVEGR